MNKIILYTSYDCLVKNKNEEQFLERNLHLIIDSPSSFIFIYPVNKTANYSFSIDTQHLENSIFYRFVIHNDTILIFLLDGLIAENTKIYNLNYNNMKSDIFISKETITFSTKEYKKQIYIPYKILDFQCKNIKHIDLVLLNTERQKIILAYNIRNNNIKIFKGNEISFTTNGFSIFSQTNLYKEIKETFIIDNDGLKIKEKTYTLSSSVKNPGLLIYNFMSLIKENNIIEAYNLLGETLKEKISTKELESFFKNITYFYTIDSQTCFAVKDNENILYSFKVVDNQIIDITDNLD